MRTHRLHAALKGLEHLVQISAHFIFVLFWATSSWLNRLEHYDKAAKQIRREDRLEH
ncbi:hypothetical protein [Photobacterium sp. Hal280]|uniref:hypothetical protein n=1 Tax=Photobacterium sp. Hal280 TaxID=3035163 RepID=UPI00301C1E6D